MVGFLGVIGFVVFHFQALLVVLVFSAMVGFLGL